MAYWDKPPKKGYVYIDIVDGAEGPSVSIGDHQGGMRVAGPKPWGGGTVRQRFLAYIADIRSALPAAPDPRDEVIRGLVEAAERSRQYIVGSMVDRSGPVLRQLDAALAAARQPYMGQIMAECDCQRQGECQRAGRCIAEVR